MKLHTTLDSHQLGKALQRAKDNRKVAPAVTFLVFEAHGSRSHDHAFDVQLGTTEYAKLPEGTVNQYGRAQKTRRRNQANTGFAATWHEWGWFMAEVFKADPGALFSSKSEGYNGVTDFDTKTHRQFTDD